MNRVLELYKTSVMDELKKQFNYSSVMEIPKIEKIVVNMGVGDSIANSKLLDASSILLVISSISSFASPFKNLVTLFLYSV